jgi:hypothetical protein
MWCRSEGGCNVRCAREGANAGVTSSGRSCERKGRGRSNREGAGELGLDGNLERGAFGRTGAVFYDGMPGLENVIRFGGRSNVFA